MKPGALLFACIVVAIFSAVFVHHWNQQREIQQGQQSHRQLILEELHKIETEPKQEGWQTSLQDLDRSH